MPSSHGGWSEPASDPLKDILAAKAKIAAAQYQPNVTWTGPGTGVTVFTNSNSANMHIHVKTNQDTDLKHGRLSTYNNHRCRCARCREAMRAYRAEYRKKYKGIPKITPTKNKRAYEL